MLVWAGIDSNAAYRAVRWPSQSNKLGFSEGKSFDSGCELEFEGTESFIIRFLRLTKRFFGCKVSGVSGREPR